MVEKQARSSASLLALIFVAGLIIGGIAASYVLIRKIDNLDNEIANLENQLSRISGNETVYYQNITVIQNATALSEIYGKVRDSVVLIQGKSGSDTVQGSGFIYNFTGEMVVITNNHVVHGTTGTSVTFSNGNGY